MITQSVAVTGTGAGDTVVTHKLSRARFTRLVTAITVVAVFVITNALAM